MTMLAVTTPVFEGPLDLLLHLIEREDLDITAVSLVQVTGQYMAALRQPDTLDLRALADFVAVGAKLVFLKSRALLPRSAGQLTDDLEVEEIATDLTAQLEEYRAFKSAASYLKELEEVGHRSFVRTVAPPLDWLPSGLESVTMGKLLEALARAMTRLPEAPEPERLQRALMNIGERRQSILSQLKRRGSLLFGRLIEDCRTRYEAIVTFLALLDLLKTGEVQAEQAATFGDILLQNAADAASEAAASA